MKILGIETTCDETSVSIVEDGKHVLSNIIATSIDLHIKTGGIIPEQAARRQIESMIPVLNEAIVAAFPKEPTTNHQQLISNHIDSIAVAYGPGLIGSLLVGVETAKTLSYVLNKPLIPVNHLIAHIYANWIEPLADYRLQSTENAVASSQRAISFPALALVVSGGHTDLVFMKSHTDIEWISGTRDDAAGEAFDKTARLLDFPYPGGIHLSRAADEYISQIPNSQFQELDLFPRPLSEDEKTLDWSFSGLKTAVLREMERAKTIEQLSNETIQQYAAEIQEAIVDSLVDKSLKAAQKYKPKSFIVGGGVSANKRLREKLRNGIDGLRLGIGFFAPEPKYSTDNAAAIATCAFYHNQTKPWQEVDAKPNLTIMGEK